MLNFIKSKFKKKSTSYRFSIGNKLKLLFSKKRDEAIFDDLEKIFYEADLGISSSLELVDKVKALLKKEPLLPTSKILDHLKKELLLIFPPPTPIEIKKPHIIMVIGVNGSGKTTTIAKLAQKYHNEEKKVIIAAADTYRAAATEQIDSWAKSIGVEIIRSKPKGDPSSVVFDAITAAKARDGDIVLIDTAGRLHTKTDLMHELEKIKRVIQKLIEDAPHETLLVLDVTTGQNGLDQAQIFNKFIPISSLVLTKLDTSAKGGIVIAIQKQLKISPKWIGTGETPQDLERFDPRKFLDTLFS